MTARVQGQRKVTAREGAELLGVSPRTIQRLAAEPREDYEKRLRERGEQILKWRANGMLWREIAGLLSISTPAAQMAGKRALDRREADTMPPPLFP